MIVLFELPIGDPEDNRFVRIITSNSGRIDAEIGVKVNDFFNVYHKLFIEDDDYEARIIKMAFMDMFDFIKKYRGTMKEKKKDDIISTDTHKKE